MAHCGAFLRHIVQEDHAVLHKAALEIVKQSQDIELIDDEKIRYGMLIQRGSHGFVDKGGSLWLNTLKRAKLLILP